MDIKDKIYYLSREQEEKHTEELAKKLNLPYINLAGYPLTEEILSIIPEENVIQYQIVPYLKLGKRVRVGAIEPNNKNIINFLTQFGKEIGLAFEITVISKTSFLFGVTKYEEIRRVKLEKLKQEEKDKTDNKELKITDLKSAASIVKSASTTKVLEVIALCATRINSSDIHIEPQENGCLIRFRIDGILQDVVSLSSEQYKQLISRIKYLSKLRMDIINKPQDGRFSIGAENDKKVDLRISIMPSTWGEAVVIRLLSQDKEFLSLDKLGLRDDALVAIRQAITKPYGMILTSGPTGSGKTTTLYAILTALNNSQKKIITLENPVEYRIEGIEQSQVDSVSGYEFADGLRASLRQDPDILMVGEIRDIETAETAVQASLTGHLLISTIHANTAPAVFARLIEIGVKPFLLSGAVNLIMAQRLIRKICPYCVENYSPRPEIWQEVMRVLSPIKNRLNPQMSKLLEAENAIFKKGKGCDKCNGTGFLGRQIIIEVLVPSEEIEILIAKKATISEFTKAAIQKGMITMEQDGLLKVLQGVTLPEEVWRVTRS